MDWQESSRVEETTFWVPWAFVSSIYPKQSTKEAGHVGSPTGSGKTNKRKAPRVSCYLWPKSRKRKTQQRPVRRSSLLFTAQGSCRQSNQRAAAKPWTLLAPGSNWDTIRRLEPPTAAAAVKPSVSLASVQWHTETRAHQLLPHSQRFPSSTVSEQNNN